MTEHTPKHAKKEPEAPKAHRSSHRIPVVAAMTAAVAFPAGEAWIDHKSAETLRADARELNRQYPEYSVDNISSPGASMLEDIADQKDASADTLTTLAEGSALIDGAIIGGAAIVMMRRRRPGEPEQHAAVQPTDLPTLPVTDNVQRN